MSEKMHRHEIFAKAAKKLREDFDSLSAVPHNALRGQEAEKLVRDFLNNHLPKRFSAGSGFIVDHKGNVSKQTDIVIYDALNCPVYRASENAAIFPSDNVAAVIEVKSNLDKSTFNEAWINIKQSKSLAKTPIQPRPYLVLTHTFGVIFAFDSKTSLDSLLDNYVELVRKYGIHDHVDLLIVLDKGIIHLMAKFKGLNEWGILNYEDGLGGSAAEGAHIAVAQNDFKEYSLDAFLRILLSHLMYFRVRVDHPGFKWSEISENIQQKLIYLTSITLEKDTEKANQKRKAYAEEFKKEFEGK